MMFVSSCGFQLTDPCRGLDGRRLWGSLLHSSLHMERQCEFVFRSLLPLLLSTPAAHHHHLIIQVKLAISHALAQSTLLGCYEERLQVGQPFTLAGSSSSIFCYPSATWTQSMRSLHTPCS